MIYSSSTEDLGMIMIVLIILSLIVYFINQAIKEMELKNKDKDKSSLTVKEQKLYEDLKFDSSYFKQIYLQENTKKSIKRIATQYKTELASERERLLKKGVFNEIITDDWHRRIIYFFEKVLLPQLSDIQKKEINRIQLIQPNYSSEYISIIDSIAENEQKKSTKKLHNFVYSENMTGIQYEQMCKYLLNQASWDVELTKKSGDQGVDLIANKGHIRLAIQCKKHSKPVGNKAVQEVVAGLKYYNSTQAVVISSSGYTNSALELANKNHVILLNHNQLLEIDELLKAHS